ncbi:TM0106 family RecB-like putative nuclease [Falsihalocynthiibacter arcticus]|uniref:DNA2/NAM7 helicase-like C-terminal domain-containing protein n=1 Tax=Falsihalocynthiibacter arcticus TaxID=1579316 RepID=A0A126V076_9RHOB|nr:TM0106 family RecB-like putative nuclease [Falsihalocynthiibacter arcticus]AML51731.1 hypothetical protein RC74_11065 [Falsihalocynthiibacter arcticus]
MRKLEGQILLSASDLMRFMGCAHATTLDIERMNGRGPSPRADSEDAALLQKQGNAHEEGYLKKLKSSGANVVEIASGNLTANALETRHILSTGPDVVFQGAFYSGNWGGWSDFLERVDRPSSLGDFSFEVTDTKLKRTPHPKHLLQLSLYSDLLSEIQGVEPEFASVELGTGDRATFRMKDFSAYARAARHRLEEFVATQTPTRPMPCSDCGLCRWEDHCKSVWIKEDSLFNVANVSRAQVKKLEAADVNTLQELSELDHPVRGIRVGTVDKFQGQEAPVCLVSMTASSADETPRGMEFLFSLNRINVAVSRAKGLSLVFGAPQLREAKCNTVEQMMLVDTLCALPDFNNLSKL